MKGSACAFPRLGFGNGLSAVCGRQNMCCYTMAEGWCHSVVLYSIVYPLTCAFVHCLGAGMSQMSAALTSEPKQYASRARDLQRQVPPHIHSPHA